jgi:patatin-like phospholipase/acyl hydrolase
MLASGYTPDECDDIYSFAAPHIFAHNPWRVINPKRAKYSDKAKQELMQHYFGDRRMGDLKKTTAIVAFRLDGRKSNTHTFFHKEGWRPAIFSNMPRAAGLVEPDNDLEVWDAAMRTSAAPTFFPVFRGYTDGGIVANNPSIVAVSKAMAHFPHVNPGKIALLSIGAGHFPRHTNVFSSLGRDSPLTIEGQLASGPSPLDHADWGIRQWIPFLLGMIFSFSLSFELY